MGVDRQPEEVPVPEALGDLGGALGEAPAPSPRSPLKRSTRGLQERGEPELDAVGQVLRVTLGPREPPGADRRLVPEEVLDAQPSPTSTRLADRRPPPRSRCTPAAGPPSIPRSARSTTPRRRTARGRADRRAARARGSGRTPRTTSPRPPRLARGRCPRWRSATPPPPCRTPCAGSGQPSQTVVHT